MELRQPRGILIDCGTSEAARACYRSLQARRILRGTGAGAAVTMGGAAVLYVLLALAFAQTAVLTQPLAGIDAFWPVLLAGTLGAGIPTVSYIVGIRLLGPPRAAILATMEPVVGVLLAAWLLAEQPALIQLLGGILVVTAAILLQLRPRLAPPVEHEAVATERSVD